MAASALVIAGTQVYSATEARKARKQAAKKAGEQKEAANRLFAEEQRQYEESKKSREMEMQQIDTEKKLSAASRQKARAKRGQSRKDTILTGPQGLQSSAPTYKKTLLGG
jgi:hypothetical protein